MTFLGIDLGTASVKAVLVDAAGTTIASGRAACDVAVPAPGRAEADPEDWWRAACQAVRAALDGAGRTVAPEAIGLSGQMHGAVLVDRAGVVLRPAVLWPDRRAAGALEAYRRLEASSLAALGNPLVPGMMGPILSWLRTNEPDSFGAADKALSPKDWLRLRMTGVMATEPSDASATLLWDLPGDDWHGAALEQLGVPRSLLPEVVASVSVAGTLTGQAAAELGVPAGTPLVAGAADVAAALAGGGTRPGELQLVVGTGVQLVVPIDEAQPDPTRRTHCYRRADAGWYAMGALHSGGLALEWARQVLRASWDEAYAALERTEPGAEGATFLPFVTGERTPYLEPGLRAGWQGLHRGHDRAHLLRAAFEGVGFAIRGARDALSEAGRQASEVRLVGGGSVHGLWQQLLADVLETDLAVVDEPDVTVRGAALLAALGAGAAGTAATQRWRPATVARVAPGETARSYREAYHRYHARARKAAEEARAVHSGLPPDQDV